MWGVEEKFKCQLVLGNYIYVIIVRTDHSRWVVSMTFLFCHIRELLPVVRLLLARLPDILKSLPPFLQLSPRLLELGRILDAQKAFDRAMDAIDRSKQIPWDDDSGTYVMRPARSQLGYFRTGGGGAVVSAVSLWLRGLEFDSRCRWKTLSETLQIQKLYCVVALRKSLKGRSN